MSKIKADLHVHLDNNISLDAVKHVLKLAETHGVKAISLLEHNELNLYKKNGVLEKLIKSGEINEIYSGKIVSGCEISCTINRTDISKLSFNYNNYDIHVTLLDFDVEKAEKIKWFTPEFQEECFKKDVKLIFKMLKKLKLEIPPKDYFKFEKHLGKQVYEFMLENFERQKKYEKVLGVFQNAAHFVRVLFEDPHGKLFFKQNRYPYLTDVLEYSRLIDARVFISHPCYMNAKFNTTDYLDTLLNIKTDLAFPYDGIEVPYFLNSVNDTKLLHDYAVSHNLEESGGTDYQYLISPQNPTGKMYLMRNGEKSYFVPIPGKMIKTFYETGNGDLFLDEKFIDKLTDIRMQNRFNNE